MKDDTRVRLMELMLYREVGGIGYGLAIQNLSLSCPDFYLKLQQDLKGIKEGCRHPTKPRVRV